MSMIHQRLATSDLPERDRYEQWREVIMRGVFGLQTEASPDQASAIDASVAGWSTANFSRFRYSSSELLVSRTRREIAQRPWDGYLVYREMRGDVVFEVGGVAFRPKVGEVVVWDADETFTTQAPTCCTWEGWKLPKSLLAPHLPALGRPLALHLPGTRGPAGLVGAYLDALDRDMSALEGPAGDLIADHLGRLVAIACGAELGSQREAVRTAKLAQALRYIDLHLADPELSPRPVAAALGISVRQLHAVFETHTTSFAGQVQMKRLHECRRVLQSPASLSRSVADIAFAWGFGSMSTFYRVFQQEFGATPSDVRFAPPPLKG